MGLVQERRNDRRVKKSASKLWQRLRELPLRQVLSSRGIQNQVSTCMYPLSLASHLQWRFDPNELHRRPEFTLNLRHVADQHPKGESHVVGATTVETHLASEDILFQDHFDGK